MKKLMFFLAIVFSLSLFASEIKPEKEWVKGSVVVGISNTGSCIYKPFVKVGTADGDPDDPPQILGYSPGNVQVDRQGQVIWERVSEATFIPMGQAKAVGGRLCRCPPYEM